MRSPRMTPEQAAAALDVACPRCGVGVGAACAGKKLGDLHWQRLQRAKRPMSRDAAEQIRLAGLRRQRERASGGAA